ncbi:Fic family protein [Rhodobacteraceae bacterium KMS-5]|uniref:Fic family protein n=1 Tax=Tabrizicola oligotrophica TaxID=2710650 RepID=A0A6M0QY82_9RHOB|nr:Fic family protein [Tabrizicola oligotrophica]
MTGGSTISRSFARRLPEEFKALFRAPPPGPVEAEMADFLRWLNTPSLTPLAIRAALARLRFETIHPFSMVTAVRVGQSSGMSLPPAAPCSFRSRARSNARRRPVTRRCGQVGKMGRKRWMPRFWCIGFLNA